MIVQAKSSDQTKACRIGLECSIELAARDDVELLFSESSLIELIPESYFFDRRREFIKKLAKNQMPVLGHCIETSIGSDEPLNTQHLERSLAVLDEVNCVVFSDHLCMTSVDGIEIGQLTTLPFTQQVVDVVCRKVELIQKRLSIPFMLENITNRFIVPGCEYSETEFINKVLRTSGCGLLLDITNLYINSVNHGFDPKQWIDDIYKPAIMGIHLAGGIKEKGVHYDTHSRAVPRPVWNLLDYVLEQASPQYIVVEWDQDMPPTPRLLQELRQVEARLARVQTDQLNRWHGQPVPMELSL